MANPNPYLCTPSPKAPAGESEVSNSPFGDIARKVFGSLGGAIGVLFFPVDFVLSIAHLAGAPIVIGINTLMPMVEPLATAARLDPVVTSSIAILLVVRAALIPLAMRTHKAMVQAQVLAPALKHIQSTVQDKERQQQAIMAFYAKNKINPFATLWIAPSIFLLVAFYGACSSLTVRSADGTFDPAFVSASSSVATHMNDLSYFASWQMDLTKSLGDSGMCMRTLPYALLITMLIVLGVAASWHGLHERHIRWFTAISVTLTAMLAVPLPAYVVILRCADAFWMLCQATILRRRIGGYRARLLADPDIQRQLAEAYIDVGALIRKPD